MNQWNNEPVNQQVNDVVSRWTRESVNWMNGWVSWWINEPMDERMNGWMDGRATSLLSYFFTEQPLAEVPLLSATSSLRSLSSGLLLLWPCRPASFSVASASQLFSSRSCCNACSNLQLQSRIARWFRAAVMNTMVISTIVISTIFK